MSKSSYPYINQLLLNIPHFSPNDKDSMSAETLATQPTSWSQHPKAGSASIINH
jgi:hypothetical protein